MLRAENYSSINHETLLQVEMITVPESVWRAQESIGIFMSLSHGYQNRTPTTRQVSLPNYTSDQRTNKLINTWTV